MPYSAFDLTVGWPIVNSSTRYFPIRRAQNNTQFTLGRTFLQYAYVIADYERSNFSVSQALFPDASVSQNIISIFSPNDPFVKQHHSPKVIIGTAVASFVFVCMIALGGFMILNRRRRQRFSAERDNVVERDNSQPYEKPELDTVEVAIAEIEVMEIATNELDAATSPARILELSTHVEVVAHCELPGISEGRMTGISMHELPAEDMPRYELESPSPFSIQPTTRRNMML